MREIKKNNDYCVNIIDINHEGRGVGKIDGFTVFVEGVVVGEQVRIKLIKVNRTYGYGKLLEIIKASDDRVDDVCGVNKRCGGCTIDHVNYLAQCRFKTKLVKDNLERIGDVYVKVNDILGASNYLYYRNKAQFPVQNVRGRVRIGFYARNSHNVIPCAECRIQNKKINTVKNIVEKFMQEKRIKGYDEKSKKGIVRHILIRVGENTGEVMVVIVATTRKIPHMYDLVKKLRAGVKGLKSVVLNINFKNTNVILGNKEIVIWGDRYIKDYIGNLKFKISPKSFYQVNTSQTKVLYDKVLEYAKLSKDDVVFDLYCGIGSITMMLASRAKFVYGVEIVEDAVKNAKINASDNGINNVEFVKGKAEDVIPRMYEDGVRADVVVVDPPRKGCDRLLLDTMVKMKPERIVYVSCNPATLARDVKFLKREGFKVECVQPVDMFPMTMHVECVVLLTR